MSEDGFSDCLDEPSMEIQIDTLMGTFFDMRVNSSDTIRQIKQRIQRVEGIPIHQQNLVFQSKELKDSYRLCDAGIQNGSTIKLIVAMKGGPISTRRLSVSCEHHLMLKELKELLENTRDEIGDKLAPGSKVSVLVFKEGDILNLLRVIENEDGSYSPYSEKPISPPSKTRKEETQSEVFEKLVEDTDMMEKMSNLRRKMEDVNLKRQKKKENDDKCLSYKLLTDSNDILDNVDLKIFEKSADEGSSETEEVALKDKHRIKPKKIVKSLYGESKGAFSHTKHNYARMHKKARDLGDNTLAVPKNNMHLTRLVLSEGMERPKSTELEENDVWEIGGESGGDRLKHSATCKFSVLKRQSLLECDDFFHVPQISAIPPQDYFFSKTSSAAPEASIDRVPPQEEGACSSIERLSNELDESIEQLYGYYKGGERALLPPVVKKRSRCSQCNKKLNITNIYDCRCGKIFCSQHRYAELHRCSYDYKGEGRRLLELQNPLVTADKVHRI